MDVVYDDKKREFLKILLEISKDFSLDFYSVHKLSAVTALEGVAIGYSKSYRAGSRDYYRISLDFAYYLMSRHNVRSSYWAEIIREISKKENRSQVFVLNRELTGFVSKMLN